MGARLNARLETLDIDDVFFETIQLQVRRSTSETIGKITFCLL